jgi:hypothetical protein
MHLPLLQSGNLRPWLRPFSAILLALRLALLALLRAAGDLAEERGCLLSTPTSRAHSSINIR